MESLNIIALGIAVRLAREEKQMTANDLALQAKMTPSSLSRSERGLRMLELDEALRVSSVLGMTPNDLIEQAQRIEQSGVAKQHQQALKQIDLSLKKVREAALRARLGADPCAGPQDAPSAVSAASTSILAI